jgi:hypothetical protein
MSLIDDVNLYQLHCQILQSQAILTVHHAEAIESLATLPIYARCYLSQV